MVTTVPFERPDQYRAIGWVKGRLYSLILEIREDKDGEFYHLVTLWKSIAKNKAV